jgi:hypothetical protein
MDSTRKSLIIFGVTFVIYLLGAILIQTTSMAGWMAHDSLPHSLLQSLATVLALFCGIAALYRFYSGAETSPMLLFLGVGFMATTLIDAYHAFVTATWFIEEFPSIPPSIAEWSWLITRLFLSVLFVLGLILERSSKKNLVHAKTVYISITVLVVLTFIICVCIRVPYPIYPYQLLARPLELIPGFFFLVALIGYWMMGDWKTSKMAFWLILFLITSVCTQFLYNDLAGYVHDFMYLVAHILKITSYAMVYVAISD